MQTRGGWDVTGTQGCPGSSAHPRPTPDHQRPHLNHFRSNDISQAAAFVVMSCHQQKLTISSPGLAIPGTGVWGRGREGADEPLGPGSLEFSCHLARAGPATASRSGWYDLKESCGGGSRWEQELFLSAGTSKNEWPSGNVGKGNSKTLPQTQQLAGRGSTWPLGPAGEDPP